MLLKKNMRVAALFIAAAMLFTGCTSDEKKVDEAVASTSGSEAAAPPSAFSAEKVYFAFDSDVVEGQGQTSLGAMAEHMKASQEKLQIEGHCDRRGSTQYNLALGDRRGKSVQTFLKNLGVDDARMSVVSYGELRPAVEGTGEEVYKQNRRVEFTLSNQ